MKNFTCLADTPGLNVMLEKATKAKQQPFAHKSLGVNKTLGLIFLNPSLRTRLSTQKAAANLGMEVMVMNVNSEGWTLELEEGVVMNGKSQEHINEAAGVISQYCDIVGLRTFASLQNKEKDYQEYFLNTFIKYAQVPVVSLESATLHPLQSLADLLTIEEHKTIERPKVVLTWAPHPKALPQAVANSCLQWFRNANVDLVLSHPEGLELAPQFATGICIEYNQNEALRGADFVYAKNWAGYKDYGRVFQQHQDWTIVPEKMALTSKGKFMHCLPVRRNVVVSDEVLDSPQSLVLQQANNRTYAAQAVLQSILESE